ncbi:MAG: Phenylalanine-tRNA ligase alpha subunit [Candidatus Curtissbacteria bacterium GW2011_GWA1_40_9]|uniref:Phenylalanine--tRNA ligase alpha subunit n=1 Tax=Candidatus Curtissbacteria bacterium GW2011_GWA1_40_9 TaxID=1618408 RepID=A0A0G0TMU6_9BACT|nr:MAG: Phenylalanine-tRNA ligase alpha subunit [Candidatus Curtissbacteria bacterium GW2011_GWA1_40_9]
MEKDIEKIISTAREKIALATDQKSLNSLYLELFGKNSALNNLTHEISKLVDSERPRAGKLINAAKRELADLYEKKRLAQVTKRPTTIIDVTAPGKKQELGHLHLVSQAIEEIVDIFTKLGFSLQSYPEVDWDWYAFESLNMPKNHPARDDWETFFIKAEKDPKYGLQVLTPHTSNGQVREMGTVKKPPIRMINISRCYRRQIDVSHTPMFHQFEGLYIDRDVSIPQLKGTFDYFTSYFFGPKRVTRLRPHHFRFTEPSFEVDITCDICEGHGCRICKEGWLELGGAGMVHPNVLKAGGIDPVKYSGFAFGWGIERTISMKTKLPDIRLLYQNDIRFLEQF